MNSTKPQEPAIRPVDGGEAENLVPALADILIDCVENGASVGFMSPLARTKAEAFWTEVAAGVRRRERTLLVAVLDGEVVGTAQVVFARPENQPHRADVSKVLVHSRARGKGIGSALMRAAEDAARQSGKTLLVLDTMTGSDAERLYTRLGWTPVGGIPGFALYPQGRLGGTTIFYKHVSPAGAAPT
ncbi:MAG TPA: GNAT family N-acetyltransferase [Azospirillaceae bacterium]|nr:GNAT family N-acetyltransferase [Azospirillaceae bacterium]